MFFNTCKYVLTLALCAIYACAVMAAPAPFQVGTVKYRQRVGPNRIRWVDEELKQSGYLGISHKGQLELEMTIVTAAALPFFICESAIYGTTHRGGVFSGRIQTLGKCLSVREDRAVHLDKCPTADDGSQSEFIFGLFKPTNEIIVPHEGFTIAGRQGLKLYSAP